MFTQRSLRQVKQVALVSVGLALPLGAVHAAESAVAQGAAPIVQRLTAEQYARTIATLFGEDINLGGRFEPGVRVAGLLQVGASQSSVSAAGFEQNYNMARAIATQVTDEEHRNILIPCRPRSENEADDGCAARFLGRTGEYLFRRPLTDDELKAWISVAAQAAKVEGNFYTGLAAALTGMLEAPEFLFRRETVAANSGGGDRAELDAYSRASKLSFFLWDSGPDAQLLAAAQAGKLDHDKGIAVQVDRMLASPRLIDGVRAFFSDMLQLDDLSLLSKDHILFPNFSPDVIADAREETLRTITDVLIRRNADYREIFTTKHTFLTPLLGSVYRVPVAPHGLDGTADPWEAYDYPAGSPQSGILTQISFVALHSEPGRSSPTERGKAVREILLCQKVPNPPPNVSFRIVQDTSNPIYRTARARLEAHHTNPVCAGCHKLIDPLGYPLENFDSQGAFRLTENGVPIDASGRFDGVAYSNTQQFAQVFAHDPAVSSCLVNRLFAYAMGSPIDPGEKEAVATLNKEFAADGYRFRKLLRRIATSEAFYSAPTAPSVLSAVSN